MVLSYFYTLLLLHICLYFLNAKTWAVISHYHWLVSGWFQCSLSLEFLSEKERSDVNSLAAWENVKTPCLLPTPPLYQAFKANAGKSAMGVPSTEHALCYPASQKRSTNSFSFQWLTTAECFRLGSHPALPNSGDHWWSQMPLSNDPQSDKGRPRISLISADVFHKTGTWSWWRAA